MKQSTSVLNGMPLMQTNMPVLIVVLLLFQGAAGKKQTTGEKMTIGIIAGLSFIVGLALLVITAWCFCCGDGCKHDIMKVVPMDMDQQEPEATSSSVSFQGEENRRMERNVSTELN